MTKLISLSPLCQAEVCMNSSSMINRGMGAGGANTNLFGKRFEELTDNGHRLLQQGFRPARLGKCQYLCKTDEAGRTAVFITQNNFRKYVELRYGADIHRNPDEAYIFDTGRDGDRVVVKILEKKNQTKEGSVETKLWAGPALKREYEIALGNRFAVHYGFCLSDYLQKKMVGTPVVHAKYATLATIFRESGIACLYGNDAAYYESLDSWIRAGTGQETDNWL